MQVNTQTTSVIICCYAVDRIEWVVQAVDSVLKQTQKPKEVIVVFDKKDGLEGVLKQKLPNSVFIIPNQAKKGLSLARNTGAKVASGDILIFLDDDAVAEPDWLKHLIDPFSDPWVVGVGGKAVPDWLGSGNRSYWFPEEIDWTVGCMYPSFGNMKKIVRNAFGCNMAFKKDLLMKVNGFDPRLGGPVSGDDTDICLRITSGDKRYHIIYEPNAVIHHKVSEKRQTFRHIAYNAWIQGVGKAITKRLYSRDYRALSNEKSYLRNILLNFLPKQSLQMFIHPRRASGKIAAVVIVTISLGLGYILTTMKIHNVNLDQYKST